MRLGGSIGVACNRSRWLAVPPGRWPRWLAEAPVVPCPSGTAHGLCPRLTRGPYSVRPWSCCCEKHPCFIKLAEGRRTHPPPPERWLVMPPPEFFVVASDCVEAIRKGGSKLPECFCAVEVGGA